MTIHECNFDGIVGPTHNYSGLSYGNTASMRHQYMPSNPREAALQGLEKMKLMMQLGIRQAVLPPHQRPHLPTLHALGFRGSDANILAAAWKYSPQLLYSVSSASAMWTANAATFSPSSDSRDGKAHFTPANLASNFHRSIETAMTAKLLKKIFSHPKYFVHHPPLPPSFPDEGAANHCRFSLGEGSPGWQLFVYGRSGKRYPARQSREASAAIARLHLLDPKRTFFVQQHATAIDAGVFHNDVVASANGNLFFFHEEAFAHKKKLLKELQGAGIVNVEVKRSAVSLQEAVQTYLFNSQIVTLPSGGMALIAPEECRVHRTVHAYVETLKPHPFTEIHYFNLHQSMQNGGGPACLRFRVVLTEEEQAAAHPGVFLTERLYLQLADWIKTFYRDRLLPGDLADPLFFREGQEALAALTKILDLDSI